MTAPLGPADVRRKIDTDVATYNARLDEARDKWASPFVNLGGWFGGTDGKSVKGAIEANAERSKRWKARGAALAGGKPLDIDDGDRVKLDTMALWVDMGNVLIRELEHDAELRAGAGLDNAVVDTAKHTVETVATGVADLAQTANDVGSALFSWRKPLLWIAVIVVGFLVLVNAGVIVGIVRGVKQLKAAKS